jgi:hypothetical protein
MDLVILISKAGFLTLGKTFMVLTNEMSPSGYFGLLAPIIQHPN